ncbi:MAG: hypothetical protein AAGD06_27045 [Acidobacteriota bacterium]
MGKGQGILVRGQLSEILVIFTAFGMGFVAQQAILRNSGQVVVAKGDCLSAEACEELVASSALKSVALAEQTLEAVNTFDENQIWEVFLGLDEKDTVDYSTIVPDLTIVPRECRIYLESWVCTFSAESRAEGALEIGSETALYDIKGGNHPVVGGLLAGTQVSFNEPASIVRWPLKAGVKTLLVLMFERDRQDPSQIQKFELVGRFQDSDLRFGAEQFQLREW